MSLLYSHKVLVRAVVVLVPRSGRQPTAAPVQQRLLQRLHPQAIILYLLLPRGRGVQVCGG